MFPQLMFFTCFTAVKYCSIFANEFQMVKLVSLCFNVVFIVVLAGVFERRATWGGPVLWYWV